MTDIFGLPVAQEAVLAPCPGRTWFDALMEGWHDPVTAHQLHDALEQFEAARAANPPPVEVTITDATSPFSKVRMDPMARTTTITVAKPVAPGSNVAIVEPSYPAPDLVFADDTPTQFIASDGHTTELPPVTDDTQG